MKNNIVKKMSVVTVVEMANDKDICRICAEDQLSLIKNADGGYAIIDIYDNDYYSNKGNLNAAEEALKIFSFDNAIIKGCSCYLGKNFWELPESLQKNILECSIEVFEK